MTCNSRLSRALDFLTYREQRVVKIRSLTLSLFYYCGILLVIFVWIIGYLMIYSHGWEKVGRMESVVTTKLHGLAFTDSRVWDNAEYMVPPKENGAFTVITSLLETHQRNSICAEDPGIPAALCSSDSHCPPDQPVYLGNGVRTGKCVTASLNSSQKTCQIRAWCPLEIDHPANRILIANDNFTVDIRNHVKFPLFEETRKNFDESMTAEQLSTCTYDESSDPNCPVFKVTTIVNKSNNKFEDMVQTGGIIEMIIEWECTFGWTAFGNNDCRPEYSFHRLDEKDPSHTRGFHLRYAEHYQGTDGAMQRTLYRAYGIRVIVTVYGQGRQFDWGELFITLGSGLSYLSGVAVFVSLGLRVAYLRCCRCCGGCLGRPDSSNETLDGAVFTDFLCCDTHKAKQCCRPNQEEVRHQHNGPADGDSDSRQPRETSAQMGNATAIMSNDINVSVAEV